MSFRFKCSKCHKKVEVHSGTRIPKIICLECLRYMNRYVSTDGITWKLDEDYEQKECE